jgi:hypothetical protein
MDCSLTEQIPWVLVSVVTIGVGVRKFLRRNRAYFYLASNFPFFREGPYKTENSETNQ